MSAVFRKWGARILLLLFVLMSCSLLAGMGRNSGTAPDSDFASRRAWGERVLGPYLDHADDWIVQSELIFQDVGRIEGIAPIGSPNRYYPGFTDGHFAKMNLEVIGEKGRGELNLPFVEILSTGQLQNIGDEASWSFAGEKHLIVKSGRSYLAENGLEEIYLELLQSAEQGMAENFVDRWDDFDDALSSTSLHQPRYGMLGADDSLLIPGLHNLYREPLLIHYGAALADLARSNESAEAYCQAAETMLMRAEDLLEEEGEQRDLPRAAEELRRANELLRLANDLAPNHESTLKLARERVILQYLHSIDGRPRPVYHADGKHDQPWADKCLGDFYREAKAYASRSPYLKQTLGGIRSIRIAPHAHSEIRVEKHDVYDAAVFLEVTGTNGSGMLLVTIREDHRNCAAIGLFADNPRHPDSPWTFRTASWTPEGGEWVKLSVKTGERFKKKKD